MKQPFDLAWRLAKEFRKQQQDSRFTSFITKASIWGISLGCAALIILLSVMNGFSEALEDKVLSSIAHGELYSVDNSGIQNVVTQVEQLNNYPFVKQAIPVTQSPGMLQQGNSMHGIGLLGVRIDQHPLAQFTTAYTDIEPHRLADAPLPVFYMGKTLVKNFKLQPGQVIRLLLPSSASADNAKPTMSFQAPTIFNGILGGEINVGGETDNFLVLADLASVSDVLEIASGAKGVQIYYYDAYQAPQLTYQIGYDFPQAVYMSDWTRTHGHLYQDIQLVKVVVYIVLILVIAVASFNIVSSLMMGVKNKQKNIAILKTMGAEESFIARVFVLQGMINGFYGVFWGCLSGIVISLSLPHLLNQWEAFTGTTVLDSEMYFISYLPTSLQFQDVLLTAAIALFLAFLATLYPAKKAANTVAAQHLH
ncbi:FtsX-like permease family protein [Opacimonas viscosa]|uniref:FtsX-like permease family protein n=1 Tax=Opacimonas viscosa TaxID=2961944 RepID=A0AA41WZW3_9ALTE|nr:FtsX-like permease family protein [Opacimonas viscosa]MCP3427337.1 FtsX-like permease family protein [Opacimonas viscosa]